MKSAFNILTHAGCMLCLVVVMTMVGCDGPTPPVPPKEIVATQLKSGTWKVNSVNIDGVSTSSFADMTLSFTATAYTSTNASPVWPASGTWNFTNDTAAAFNRNDGVVVSIDAISETALTLRLTWDKTTLGNARTKSVRGSHIFNLKK